MMMFFPPISRWHFLNVGAQASLIIRPTSVDPVKLISCVPALARIALPTTVPFPATMFNTPGGSPASAITCTRLYVDSGVSSAGLITTVFPQISAGIIFHDGMAMGKFHGVINPFTPTGVRTDIANLFGSSEGVVCPNCRRPSPAIKYVMSMA